MSKLRDWVVPDDWQTLPALYSSLTHVVGKTSHVWLKHLVGFGLPFGLGFGVTFWFVTPLPNNYATVIRGCMTLFGILSGFMVTLMLFTGKLDKADNLSLETAKLYRDKVFFLLWSQMLTLFTYLLSALICLLWLALSVHCNEVPRWTSALLGGAISISMLRAVLLPWQIFEIHQFTLEQIVQEKQDMLNKEIDRLHSQ